MQLGIVAGDIWHYLDENGKVRLSQLMSEIEKPRDILLMSIGWLAREGHVLLEGDEDYSISLRKDNQAQQSR
jgi:hypothetical protein